MNRHHLRFVLRQHIEHKNTSNLRLHVWTSAVGWLGLTTALSQVPLALPFEVPILGANLGTAFVVASLLYWISVDALVTTGVAALTVAWAALPFSWWGKAALGQGIFITEVTLPLVVFVA